MLRPTLTLLRPTHWAKNVFVLSPLVFSEQLTNIGSLKRAALAFILFCAGSSAVYVFNDIQDRDEDRNHPLKRHRPIASGALSVANASVIAVLLSALALLGSAFLGTTVLVVMAVYLLVNLGYSLRLKHWVIVDVMLLSAGFVLRVLGGAQSIRVEVSAWLLLCTIFLSLFLAFSKRRHELVLLAGQAPEQRPVLTHYSPTFLDQMINVVTASSVLAYALYCVAPETTEKFGTTALVYTVPFVLFGIFRYLYLVYQKTSPLNPTEAILRDRQSLVNLLLWSVTVMWIVYR